MNRQAKRQHPEAFLGGHAKSQLCPFSNSYCHSVPFPYAQGFAKCLHLFGITKFLPSLSQCNGICKLPLGCLALLLLILIQQKGSSRCLHRKHKVLISLLVFICSHGQLLINIFINPQCHCLSQHGLI